MPCRSDYMEATARERELGLVLSLLAELDGKPFDHSKSLELGYGNHIDNLDALTDRLCQSCASIAEVGDMPNRSLELQIWYRDHLLADERRNLAGLLEALRDEREAREAYERLKKRFEGK